MTLCAHCTALAGHFPSASTFCAAAHQRRFCAGLYFMQPLDLITVGEQVVQVVRTEIVYAPSGETRTSICPIRSKDNQDPQKMGSGITYAKRYSLQAAFGLPSEDDDGEAGAGRVRDTGDSKLAKLQEKKKKEALY